MSGEFLSVTLAGGETKTFQKAGRYFEIIADGGSTVNLAFYGANGAVSANWNNCQSGLFIEDPWTAFTVTNNSATAQGLTFLLMDNGRGGSRRQPGVVQVVDTASIRTRSSQSFAWRHSAIAAAGQFPISTIGNPAGSGKRIVIQAIMLTSSIAGSVSIGTASADAPSAPTTPNVTNKLFGGPAGIAVIKVDSSATIAGGYGTNTMLSVFLQANGAFPVSLRDPIVLLPGQHFIIYGDTPAQTISGMTEWYEEANS